MDVVEVENEAEATKVQNQENTSEDDSEGAATGPDEGSGHPSGNQELLSSAGVEEKVSFERL